MITLINKWTSGTLDQVMDTLVIKKIILLYLLFHLTNIFRPLDRFYFK